MAGAGTHAAIFLALCAADPLARGQTAAAGASGADEAPSQFRSADDGQFDVSGFLDQKYGFLPIVLPITEPAVGYGAAGALAFIDKPMGAEKAGFNRPNITAVGGMWTENGSQGALVGDVRHWLDDRLQTVAGIVDASINLDFHGVGESGLLDHDPLRYTLEPTGAMLQAKYRLGDSRVWAGLGYSFARMQVRFDAPAGTPGLPDFEKNTDLGSVTPSLTYDSRDNIFTPAQGNYLEFGTGVYSHAFGGDDEFQRARLIGMHFTPLSSSFFLGLRGEAAASFGDAPFYMRPFIALRGVPIMRYQGDEVAQLEAELRWQFWERFSLVGFAGGGAAWNDSAHFDSTQTVLSGGTGFRYELARKYGIHAGLDVAFSQDTAAVYIQIGSAWARP